MLQAGNIDQDVKAINMRSTRTWDQVNGRWGLSDRDGKHQRLRGNEKK